MSGCVCWGIVFPIEEGPIHRITIELLEKSISEVCTDAYSTFVYPSLEWFLRLSQATCHQTQASRTMLPSITSDLGHMTLPSVRH